MNCFGTERRPVIKLFDCYIKVSSIKDLNGHYDIKNKIFKVIGNYNSNVSRQTIEIDACDVVLIDSKKSMIKTKKNIFIIMNFMEMGHNLFSVIIDQVNECQTRKKTLSL